MEGLWSAVNRVWGHLLVIILALELMVVMSSSSSRLHSCPRHCHCKNVTVDCSNSHMVQLGQQFPPKSLRLVMDHNRIARIPAKTFQGLTQLNYLSMVENNISVIEPQALDGLDNLRLLFLDKNYLRQLPEEVFTGVPRLGNLSLSNNGFTLKALNESVVFLQNVEGLNLKNNMLDSDRAFPIGFSAMSNLRILDLGGNQGLRNITEDYFEALQGLEIQWLSLQHCPIVEVHPEAFLNLPHLHHLDLSETMMPLNAMENILQGLVNSSLVSLNLEYVFVYSDIHAKITPDFFFSLRGTGLTDLNMEGNYGGFLGSLHNGLFRWMRELRHLTLDKCHITSVSRDAFKGLHRLKKLSLRHNFISCVMDCQFITYGPVLHNLMVLDLSDNVISRPKNTIRFTSSNFPRLHHLYLQNNRISSLEEGMFDIKSLRTLDLSGNPIHHIQSETFRYLHSLESLTITGSIFLQVLPNGTFKGLKNLLRLQLNNNQLQSIHPRAFNGLHSLELLEMNGNRIGGQGNFGDLHISAELRRLRRLDLGNNRLEAVPVDVLVHQPRLRVLLLHYNRIAYVDKRSLGMLKELETLDLSYNDIMEVGDDTFSNLPALRKLDMAGNPFLCTCRMKNFLDWLRSTEVKLNSVDQHKCSGPLPARGKKLLAYSPTAWECRIKSVIVPLLTILGLVVLCAAFSCLIYRCVCRRHDHLGGSGDDNKDRKGRNWGWIRELLPVNGEMTPSGSEEGNVEDPLIEREHELCQETMCQESQTEENHIL